MTEEKIKRLFTHHEEQNALLLVMMNEEEAGLLIGISSLVAANIVGHAAFTGDDE